MKLRKMESPEEIVKILGIEDNVEDYISGDRSAWVQWLMQQASSEEFRVHIWGVYEEGLLGYMVVVDNRFPPLSEDFYILYASNLALKNYKELSEQVFDELKELGCKKLSAITVYPDILEKYGFQREQKVLMSKEL